MKAFAVIGSNFGDEGKGLMTDFLADRDSIVVRYNGGAQAGHTVVTNSRRHVFHHFGSGSFSGAATYLSEFFIVNPFLWNKERDELGFIPKTLINPEALLTTPWDMWLNQASAQLQGYGSCGVGINETRARCSTEYKTIVGDIWWNNFRDRLLSIRDIYVPLRAQTLGILDIPSNILSDTLLDNYISACRDFCNETKFSNGSCLKKYSNVVFEGAQGLLLDEDHRFFPHVTPSKTGLPNVASICSGVGIKEVDAIYVTRSYMTRHGAGPFPTESNELSFFDNTNHYNDFQKSLRFGELDLSLMYEAIKRDPHPSILVYKSLAMTHLDQFGDVDFANRTARNLNIPLKYYSLGPKKSDVRTR